MGAITAEVVDTGEKRDTRGRRVTIASRRGELVRAFATSGMTMAAFARREGIRYSTFAHWVIREQKAAPAKPRMTFTELQLPFAGAALPPTGEHLEVRLPDGAVVRGARVADVVALVRALRG
jgi:transposase-like protein